MTFAVDPCIIHHFSEGVYAKQMSLPKGYKALTHKHVYSHLAVLAQGKAIVRINEVAELYVAPTCIEIIAGQEHEIEALEDISWFCIHATDEKSPERVDQVAIGR